jgi:hypothetical protein
MRSFMNVASSGGTVDLQSVLHVSFTSIRNYRGNGFMIMEWAVVIGSRTAYGELKIRSPNRMDPRDSDCRLIPSSGLQKWKAGL